MSVSSADTTTEAKPAKKERKIGYQAGFALVGVLVVLMVVTLPIAAVNLVESVRNPSEDRLTVLIEPTAEDPAALSALNIEVLAIDDVQQLITLRVSGSHTCKVNCTYKEKYTFYSAFGSIPGLFGLPPSESLTVPANSVEINTKFQLPMTSNLIAYPFDRANLLLGITVDRIAPDNSVARLPDDEARKELLVTIQDRIPRLNMNTPEAIPPADVRPDVDNFSFFAVEGLTFSRPIYLRVLTTLVALLIATAAAYAAFLRPFDQLIINAGALVLGVYGIRSLILGSLPNDVTALDIYLTCVALFLLCTIAVRGFNYLHLKSGWHIPGLPVEKAKTTRKCPYCKTDVEKDATRCPHCTSILEPETDEATEDTAEAEATPAPEVVTAPEPATAPRSAPPGVAWPGPLASPPASAPYPQSLQSVHNTHDVTIIATPPTGSRSPNGHAAPPGVFVSHGTGTVAPPASGDASHRSHR